METFSVSIHKRSRYTTARGMRGRGGRVRSGTYPKLEEERTRPAEDVAPDVARVDRDADDGLAGLGGAPRYERGGLDLRELALAIHREGVELLARGPVGERGEVETAGDEVVGAGRDPDDSGGAEGMMGWRWRVGGDEEGVEEAEEEVVPDEVHSDGRIVLLGGELVGGREHDAGIEKEDV